MAGGTSAVPSSSCLSRDEQAIWCAREFEARAQNGLQPGAPFYVASFGMWDWSHFQLSMIPFSQDLAMFSEFLSIAPKAAAEASNSVVFPVITDLGSATGAAITQPDH
jgi:hypothetical protein